ncbi:MAG TPA: YlxR family protein, partial [Abditibacteriaceae bacterium]|nr:YlxR family protein [Abditibacteriaceae bacterium]
MSAKVRHQPVRTCVGCGAQKPQREMLRIAARAGSEPAVDVEYCAPGRGAYLCRTQSCLERALKRRAVERSLKLKNGVGAKLKTELE